MRFFWLILEISTGFYWSFSVTVTSEFQIVRVYPSIIRPSYFSSLENTYLRKKRRRSEHFLPSGRNFFNCEIEVTTIISIDFKSTKAEFFTTQQLQYLILMKEIAKTQLRKWKWQFNTWPRTSQGMDRRLRLIFAKDKTLWEIMTKISAFLLSREK